MFDCTQSDNTYKTRKSLTSNIKKKHQEKLKFDAHYAVVENNNEVTVPKKKLYPCDVCNKDFINTILIEHKKSHAVKTFMCQKCEKEYASSRSLNEHIKVKHNENAEKVVRSLCNMTFTKKSSLPHHLKSIHKKGKLPELRLFSFQRVKL